MESSKNNDLIYEDRYFLIIDNKESRKFCTINMNKVKLSKKNIDLSFFRGKRLNTFWDLTDLSNIVEISSKEFFNEDHFEDEQIEYSNEKIIGTSNKEIYSNCGAQKLSDDQIKQLKSSGVTGDELIKTIINSNTSMEKRTIFSQEKIIKKKERKHKHLVWITPTTIWNIIETFFIQDIRAINFLRMDTVSSMLVNSNFQKGTRTLIYEETNNILTHCYAMRTQLNSKIYHIFNDKVSVKNMNLFNLTEIQKAVIAYIEYKQLMDKEAFMHKMYQKEFKNYFDNLVICVKEDIQIPKIFFSLFDYLKNSGNIVIFAKDKEILATVDKIMGENKMGIDIKIIETITREYQILPLRTHPMMNQKGYSGYVLAGYKLNCGD